MKKIAILGAAGYIGKSLTYEFFLEKNEHIFLFSRSPKKLLAMVKMFPQGVRYNICNLSDFSNYDFDVVINCTGVGDSPSVVKNPSEIFTVTESVDTMVLTYLEQKKEQRKKVTYINISSGAVYGGAFTKPASSTKKAVLHGSLEMSAEDYYSVAKMNAEMKHRSHTNLTIFDIRVFAFFSRFVDFDSHFFMSDVAKALVTKKTMVTFSDDMVRDYCVPHDLHALIVLLMKRKGNDCFDMYSLRPVSKLQVLTYFKKQYGLQYSLIERDSVASVGRIKKNYYSRSKHASTLGYIPKFTSLQGLVFEVDKLIERYKNNNN